MEGERSGSRADLTEIIADSRSTTHSAEFSRHSCSLDLSTHSPSIQCLAIVVIRCPYSLEHSLGSQLSVDGALLPVAARPELLDEAEMGRLPAELGSGLWSPRCPDLAVERRLNSRPIELEPLLRSPGTAPGAPAATAAASVISATVEFTPLPIT